ncbi:MAG TPA: hypothetical protein VEG30_05800 [Terriglobales bacterium]|nr:hypothetical protein [Terriglobales bacterium]
MASESKSAVSKQKAQAAQQVADAHHLLTALRERLEKHPELDQAILKLEQALNVLTLETGGML